MRRIILFILIGLVSFAGLSVFQSVSINKEDAIAHEVEHAYWMLLRRKSNIEYLYFGLPGDVTQSTRVRTFTVKTGVPGKKPTPLPSLLGREYWLIVDKFETPDDPETAPYFLTLNIPVSDEAPFGPTLYEECDGKQCNWELPGYFGLHGVAGDETRLATDNEGSSGCIRHSDEAIAFLYDLLDPAEENIRYYVEDN